MDSLFCYDTLVSRENTIQIILINSLLINSFWSLMFKGENTMYF